MAKQIDICVRLDAATFRRYCAFDTFRRQRRWYLPVLASMLLITASLAGLLGLVAMPESLSGLLLGLGIAVPAVVFGLYLIQIEAQIAGQRLKESPPVYALRLDADGVRVSGAQKQEDSVFLNWNSLLAAYRRKGAVYLYVNAARALILPDGQASVSPDALWSFLGQRLGPDKCFDLR